MRLHRLFVRDYKGIAQREVIFPECGILVIEGPNEIGKSTMLDALDLVLEHKDSSRRAQIRSARPVDRDVAPCVEVELSTGGHRFVYRKQWLRQPATELQILSPQREHLVGTEAHDRVLAILARSADMHLWRALRLMQAGPLVQGDLSSSSALAAALDEAGGTTPDGGGAAESLLAAAEATYLRYFTAHHGQPTGAYRAAIDRHEAAHQAVTAAQEAMREVADDVERHESLEAGVRDARAQSAAAEARRRSREVEWLQARDVADRLASARRRRDEVAQVLDRALERVADRGATESDLRQREQALESARDRLGRLREQFQPTSSLARDLADEHERARRHAAQARARLDAVSARAARARDEADLRAWEKRLVAVEEAQAQVRAARAGVQAHPVTTADLRRIEAAVQAAELAAAGHAAGSAAIVLRTLGEPHTIVVDGQSVSLEPGREWSRVIDEPLEVGLGGLFEVRLRPGEGAARRAAAVQEADDALHRLLASAGVSDAAGARDCHDRRREHEDGLAQAQARLGALLEGDDPADLVQRIEAVRARMALATGLEAGAGALHASGDRAAGRTPQEAADANEMDETVDATETVAAAVTGEQADAGNTVDPTADDASDPVEALAAAAAAESQARADADRAASRLLALREQVDELRGELLRAESLEHAAQEALAIQARRLEVARQARPTQALAADVEAAERSLQVADDEVEDHERHLVDHDLEALEQLHLGAQAEVQSCRERLTELEQQVIRVQARLEQAGGQGRAETLDSARSELAHARREHDRLRRHAEAAKLLRDTLTARSQAAKRAYVRPFSDAVARLGRIVYGPSFDVEVDEDLTIRARILQGTRIEFDALSTGAKEQLAILVRLACASIVDPDQGVPVVIDDALGYSDPDKLRRVCAAVGRLGTQAQVVLLTCTPGRYAAIPQAHVLRL